MKVSVFLPVYNGEKYLRNCLDSVLAQDYQDYEILVVDDCSEDRTTDIVKALAAKEPRIRFIQKPSHDYIKTLNTGLCESKGEYIARIDADDTMAPNRLSKQVACMDANPTIDVCCSWYEIVGGYNYLWKHLTGIIVNPYQKMLLGNIILNPSTMLRKEFFDKHQIRYRDEYIYAEDYQLWIETAKVGGVFYVIPENLTCYRRHDKQVSIQFRPQQDEAALRIRTELLNDLLDRYCPEDNRMTDLFNLLADFNDEQLVTPDSIFRLCYEIVENKSYR